MNSQSYVFNRACQGSLVVQAAGTPDMLKANRNPKRQRGRQCIPSLALRACIAVLCLIMLALSGCQAVINPYDARIEPPVPEAISPGRERSMVSLPAYRIEPPDMLQIEMLKLVPLPPYRSEVFDVLQIRAQRPVGPAHRRLLTWSRPRGSSTSAGLRHRPRGRHDHRRDRTHAGPLAQAVPRRARGLGAVGPQFRHPAGHRPVPGRARRHDQPAAVRHGARGRQDGDRDPPGHRRSTCSSSSTRRRSPSTCWPTTARCYYVITAGGRAGRQRPPPAGHRQRDGAGRDESDRRAVAALQQEDVDCPARAGQLRLRADPAGRLGRHCPRRRRRPPTTSSCRATGCSSPRTRC